MRAEQQRKCEIEADELAGWVESQGLDHWWTVDGDWRLMQRLSLPCMSDELAAEIRKIGLPLIIVEPEGWPPRRPNGRMPRSIDDFAVLEPDWGHVLQLRWKAQDAQDWLLMEDMDITEAERREADLIGSSL